MQKIAYADIDIEIIPSNTSLNSTPKSNQSVLSASQQFKYSGQSIKFCNIIESLSSEQLNKIKNINILLIGQKIQKQDNMCLYFTLIMSILLILPLLIIFCNCWKRRVKGAYKVSYGAYQSLSKLFSGQKLVSITLKVIDDNFNKTKAILLYNALANCKAKKFLFVNRAIPQNFQQRQYTQFRNNISNIMQLTMKKRIIWGKII